MEERTIIQFASPDSVRRGVRLNGTYEIEALIAKGGMGEVYKGFNIQTNDPVAIKMVLPELARNPDAFALFRREASTLLNLQHEAIVRYFVFSVDPELQRAYLAMEFVEGLSLTARLRQGPLSLTEAAILRKRVAGGLEAAHRFGVIHRDISSDNIILPNNDPKRAKIIDFGIARSTLQGEGTLIGDGFAGKYNYVSPEQLGLAGGEVTAKSDIYSFGLVLAEALRGRPIHMNGTQVEIIEKRRSVPDLSDIDPSMRPLLQAMLQPLPADRPESMAAVAAWDESGTAGATPAQAAPKDRGRDKGPPIVGARPESRSSTARLPAILGAIIVIVSIGGTLFVFRDVMPWNAVPIVSSSPVPVPGTNQSAAPTPEPGPESGSTHKLPPLPDLLAHEAGIAPNIPATDNVTPPTTVTEIQKPLAQPEPHVPSADELVQSLNQMKQQKSEAVASNQASNVAVPSSAQASAPPAKPMLPDAPQKKSEPAPPPPIPTPVSTPTPVVASLAPPRPSQSVLAMADAVVGRDYVADLPPFSDSGDLKGLALHAEPNPPEGLSFIDLGSGFGQISGKPSKPGQYSFQIVAKNQTGATAAMTTRIGVAPAPPAVSPPPPTAAAPAPTVAAPPLTVVAPPPPTVVAPPPAPATPPKPVVAMVSPGDKALSFIRDFNGGACFLARPLGAGSDSIAIQGIGSDKATFERFYSAFIHEIGVEPALNVRLIGSAQCPAVDLIRAAGGDRVSAPKIELAGYDVGQGKPLAGTVVNLAGRHLDLLLVSGDGQVYRLDSRTSPGGDSAAFNVPITPDAASVDTLQLLLAVSSSKPAPALNGFKAGAAADILPRLRSELRDAGALDVEFFKLVR